MTGVYSVYIGSDEPIGMDHVLFAARTQARIWACWEAREGVPLHRALQTLPPQINELFGDVPAGLIAATITTTYASIAAENGASA